MQDRLPPARRNPLATHGRTIHWVKLGPRATSELGPFTLIADVRGLRRHVRFVPQPDSRIAANSISIRSPRLRAVSSDDGTFIRPRICSVHTQSLNHDQASVEIEFPNGLSHTVSASEHTLTCGRSLD